MLKRCPRKYDMKDGWMQAAGMFLYRPEDDVIGKTCYMDRIALSIFFTVIL
jgi:hypothetical protein